MQLPEAFRRLPRPSSALKPSHPPDGVACRAYSVTLQCLFSIGNTRIYVFGLCSVIIASRQKLTPPFDPNRGQELHHFVEIYSIIF